MRLSLKWTLLLAIVAICGASCLAKNIQGAGIPAVGADPQYLLTFNIGGNVGSALLNTTDLGGGQFLVTSGTLDVTAGGDIGTYPVIPGGPAVFGVPGFNVDNVLYPAGDPILDVYGLAFGSGSLTINIWGNGPGNYSFYSYDGNYNVAYDGPGTATATAVPEPTSLLLLSSGLLGIARITARKIMGRP